jgi:hypothetical protein
MLSIYTFMQGQPYPGMIRGEFTLLLALCGVAVAVILGVLLH